MGLRFFRRVRIAPGLTLNLSKSGGSLSIGMRGARYTVGPRGRRSTVPNPHLCIEKSDRVLFLKLYGCTKVAGLLCCAPAVFADILCILHQSLVFGLVAVVVTLVLEEAQMLFVFFIATCLFGACTVCAHFVCSFR